MKRALPVLTEGALAIRLPALDGADPACADCAATTAFGIAFTLEDPRETTILIRVPPPWLFLAGNEHEAAMCMDGGPVLEYGQPLACVATWGTQFGIGTTDPHAPSVDSVLEILPNAKVPEPAVCCPYLCAP